MVRLFSIKHKNSGGVEKKIITLFGLKISYKRKWKMLKNLVRYVYDNNSIVKNNRNLCNLLLFASLRDNDLLYIKTSLTLIIFTKSALNAEAEFVRDFLFRHAATVLFFNFGVLSKKSPLYKAHEHSFDNGEIICKYVNRWGCIAKTVISQDSQGCLFYEQNYIGRRYYSSEFSIVFNDTPKRKIIDGVSLGDFFESIDNENDRKRFLHKFFDWLFETYSVPEDKDKVLGKLWDCHLWNFVINDEGIHFIDEDLVSAENLDKNYCLWRGCSSVLSPLYPYFAEYYGYENKAKDYESRSKNFEKSVIKWEQELQKDNKELIDFYFGRKSIQRENDFVF